MRTLEANGTKVALRFGNEGKLDLVIIHLRMQQRVHR